MNSKQVALVSGGNRGLGLGICRQLADKGFYVLLASRDIDAGQQAVDAIGRSNVTTIKLDVTSAPDIAAVAETIKQNHARLDVLVNNAGILIDAKLGEAASICDVSKATLQQSLAVNTIAPVMLINALLPMMRQAPQARIINISSGMGQLSEMGGQYAGYRISKTALNSVTAIYAAELDAEKFKINSVCPGWVRTDMGGENADLSIEEGIDTVIWLATSGEAQHTGGYFRNRELIDW